MTAKTLEPSVEVEHLRRVLDTQPGCLLRVALDGLVLAANDAALRLLGVESLAQALGRRLNSWMVPAHQQRWAEFAGHVSRGLPTSFECDLTGPAGSLRPTLFHGVPMLEHPDGVTSVLVAARDLSDRHRLETSLEASGAGSGQPDPDRAALEVQLHDAVEDRRRTFELLAALEATQQALVAEHITEQAKTARSLRALASQHDVDLGQGDTIESDEVIDFSLTNAVPDAGSSAAGERAEALVQGIEASQRSLVAGHQADRQRLQKALQVFAEQHQLDLLLLAEGEADRRRLEESVLALSRQADAGASDRAAVQGDLARADDERRQLEAAIAALE
ncbi:MAG: PAS domain-containing protein, partial [Acidobacteria bacterium]|nr:PAS domain-containing protein [Acidobacteriota bacterium]